MTTLTSNIRRAANSLAAENLDLDFADKTDINAINDKLTDLEYGQVKAKRQIKAALKKFEDYENRWIEIISTVTDAGKKIYF
uniref:Uncharacterized protein n=1 Tax=Panagrolaimus sp. PS1159 TaxID=55785 RepID=A0AC35FBA1_9BILA